MLKLVALAVVFSVGPATASQFATTKAPSHRGDCPKKHAQMVAAGTWHATQHAKGATTITLPDRVPDGSALDLGWRRGFITP
jgi:hypothetical protein